MRVLLSCKEDYQGFRGNSCRILSFSENPVKAKGRTIVRAFSVAEAMIALILVSVTLAMSAPLISRQMKNSSGSSLQLAQLMHRIEALEATVPPGAVMYFDPDLVESCPDGWERVPDKYAGRYFRVAGTYNICDRSGENATTGACSGSVDRANTLAVGTFSGDTMRRIRGTFPGMDGDALIKNSGLLFDASIGHSNSYVKALKDFKILSGAFDYVKPSDAGGAWDVENYQEMKYMADVNEYSMAGDYIRYIDPSVLSYGDDLNGWFFLTKFDSSMVVPTAEETTPKSVAMLACRKTTRN